MPSNTAKVLRDVNVIRGALDRAPLTSGQFRAIEDGVRDVGRYNEGSCPVALAIGQGLIVMLDPDDKRDEGQMTYTGSEARARAIMAALHGTTRFPFLTSPARRWSTTYDVGMTLAIREYVREWDHEWALSHPSAQDIADAKADVELSR